MSETISSNTFERINELEEILDKKYQKRENEFIKKHLSRSNNYYKYLLETVFPFLEEIEEHKILWKIVSSGISIYVEAGNKQQRFMSIDLQTKGKLKFEFFYPNVKGKIDEFNFDKQIRIGGDDNHYWYYVKQMIFDQEIRKQIKTSYSKKVKYMQ